MLCLKTTLSALFFSALLGGQVHAFSDRVEKTCENDYMKFCKQYDVSSNETRRCMEANRSSLTKRCVDALFDAGEVPTRYKRARN